MKQTVLDIVQDILSSMDSDEVNSIGDTVESMQVARIVKTAYNNILTRADLPEHKGIFNLLASGDDLLPVLMHKPENVRKMEWLKYDNSEDASGQYEYVTILPNQHFLDMIHQLNPEEVNIETFILDDFRFHFYNDRKPCYCTVLRDLFVIFDGFDNTIESTLQVDKTLAFGHLLPTFELTDTFIPELDDLQFSLLLNEAKSLAFLELKQTAHEQAIKEARTQWQYTQRNKSFDDLSDFDKLPNFGRKNVYHRRFR